MRSRSLLRRAIAFVLLIEALCALSFVSTSLLHEWHTRLKALDVAIAGRSDSLIGAIQDAEDPEDHVTVDRDEFSPPTGDLFVVFDANGKVVGSSNQTLPAVTARGAEGFRNIRVEGHGYRVLQRKALRIIDREETHGVGLRRPVTVLYATRTDHLWHEIVEATQFEILVSIGLLCVTALVLVILLQRLLSPLEQLAARAAEIDTHALIFDPPQSARRVKELVPLVEALSGMIARVRAAFDAQNRFINDAAHELKTAVSVVRSSIQVLSMRNRTLEEYRVGLDQVLTDNERVEALVQQMLSLARFQEQSGAPPSHIDLADHARLAMESLRSVAEARAVLLNYSFTRGATVALTPEAARILISNLVLNAVQHSASGSEISVFVCIQSGETPAATLVVRDSGSGIASQNLSRIFERFFREDPSRSRETGGAGLGLAICKSIVDGAGGIIEVQSELGKGTVVTVALPVVEAAVEA